MPATVDLLSVSRGAVVAPAGCGKTHSIVDAVSRNDGKPVLVLTHTNAGVCAVRTRLSRARVAAARYRVATLDGWALQVVLAYPELAGLRPDLSSMSYPALRDAAVRALESGALDAILRATYGRVIVDEYQDCSGPQHRLVLELARRLPCVVLGDPLQNVFDFGGPLPDWDGEVLAEFPLVAELDRPHRWLNAGEGIFGQWILDIRPDLLAGRGVDLSTAPANVRWIDTSVPGSQIRAEFQAMAVLGLAGHQHSLVVGDARNRGSRAEFARRHAGVHVVEPVDMPDLLPAVGLMSAASGTDRVTQALVFASSVMTGIDQPFATRMEEIARGAVRASTEVELACVAALQDPSFVKIGRMLDRLSSDPSHRVFRPDLLSVMIQGTRRAEENGGDLRGAVVAVREARRAEGRALPVLGVGSTLLLKGLEADHAVVLNAAALNARHLYVAISRASRTLTAMSPTSVVGR